MADLCPVAQCSKSVKHTGRENFAQDLVLLHTMDYAALGSKFSVYASESSAGFKDEPKAEAPFPLGKILPITLKCS